MYKKHLVELALRRCFVPSLVNVALHDIKSLTDDEEQVLRIEMNNIREEEQDIEDLIKEQS